MKMSAHEIHRRTMTYDMAYAMGYAIGITVIVLALFAYWFGVANRYDVFLYEHLGATPFDGVTLGRYRMAGLVAAAIVMLLYLPVNWALGWATRRRHAARSYLPPAWWLVWGMCALPVAVGILLITMNLNQPTLPLSLAMQCVLVTWGGLALAVAPGGMAAVDPRQMLWLAWIGGGIVPMMAVAHIFELPAQGRMDATVVLRIVVGCALFGVVWTMGWLQLYSRRRKQVPPLAWLLVAGAIWSYLFLPLAHYWLATPSAHRYITAGSNFFADSWGPQLLTYAIVLVVLLVAYLPMRWIPSVRAPFLPLLHRRVGAKSEHT